MKCNIIGAGRLGKNIALALFNSQIISSFCICNRTYESALKACQELGFGVAVAQISELPQAEITWICSGDDAISSVVEALANQSVLKPGTFIIHSSGVLNSSILAPLKVHGCFIASFHPLKAFKTHYIDKDAFYQVDCVLEGDAPACNWINQSFTALGAYISAIKPENKARYHAAACIASNYLITLASCSEALFLKAGLNKQQSRRMLINLMQGNLTNLQHTERIAESLTGPLIRGDKKTLRLHLDSIENPLIHHLYQAAGLATLPLTNLTEKEKKEIKNLLSVSRETKV
jgi:predicted short-subunit dehydrogenase-like oxidoreductase (DUF2520 family)